MFKNKKLVIATSVCAVVILLGIAYAAFTQTLNIAGTADVRNSQWKVYFSRLTGETTTGTAAEVVAPTIDANMATTIGDYEVTVMTPGDTISYEIDVTNDGDYDATLSDLSINATPTCKVNNNATDTSAVNVCKHLHYTLKYKSNNASVAINDTLLSKETKTLVLKLEYEDFTTVSDLPTSNVDITGLGVSLTYVQSGKAKVNADGTTPLV